MIKRYGSKAMRNIVHKVIMGPPHYPVAGVYIGIGITLTGITLSQVAVMIAGIFTILLASCGLILGKEN